MELEETREIFKQTPQVMYFLDKYLVVRHLAIARVTRGGGLMG